MTLARAWKPFTPACPDQYKGPGGNKVETCVQPGPCAGGTGLHTLPAFYYYFFIMPAVIKVVLHIQGKIKHVWTQLNNAYNFL